MNDRLSKALDVVIVLVNIVLDALLELTLGWYWGPRKICSAPTPEQVSIVTKGAVELASLIRERHLRSYDVVKAFYDRTLQVHPELNAVADGPFADALEEAAAIDRRLDSGEISKDELNRKPFLGVPFSTKDSTAVRGKLHTLGLISRKSERAPEDAECVRLMKESGAIVLATSNVPELNRWAETRSLLFGQTNNPYDLRRSVGGSSGGEGALINSCCSAFGLGTDIGGSIRLPCFNCGIFGHKPSSGVVNTRGCTLRTGKEENTMVAAGPMARNCRDLTQMLKVLAGPETSKALKLHEPVDLRKLRYFYMPNNNMKACNPINSETEAMMAKVRRHFTELGAAEVKLAKLPHLELTRDMWTYWMSQEPEGISHWLGDGSMLNPFIELFKKLIGQSQYSLGVIFVMINNVLPTKRPQLLRDATVKCKAALDELLGDDGVLFFHSSPRTAPFHYYPLLKFVDAFYFSIFNVLHVPVTQVPMGLDSKGLPMGIQVVATNRNDRLCLAVAAELERQFGGWAKPFASTTTK